jgi:hypothetical protein
MSCVDADRLTRYYITQTAHVSLTHVSTLQQHELRRSERQEEQYSIYLPRSPADIVFHQTHVLLVHPREIVCLDLKTGLEDQVIESPVPDGAWKILDKSVKGMSPESEGRAGVLCGWNPTAEPDDRIRVYVAGFD